MAIWRRKHSGKNLTDASFQETDVVRSVGGHLETWLLSGEIPPAGLPVSLRMQKSSWAEQVGRIHNGKDRKEALLRLSNVHYMKLCCGLFEGKAIEKAILLRMLGGYGKRPGETDIWPALIDGREELEFGPFSAYVCFALYNLLGIVASIRAREPRDTCYSVEEFLVRARQRIEEEGNEKDRSNRIRLSLEDLLAAHIIVGGMLDMEEAFAQALKIVDHPRFWDRLFPRRWKRRSKASRRLFAWYEDVLRGQVEELDPLRLLLRDDVPWDDQSAQSILRVAERSTLSSVRRWLAWEFHRRISRGEQAGHGPLKALEDSLRNSSEGDDGAFAAEVMLELISGVPAHGMEKYLKMFRDGLLAQLCGRITHLAARSTRSSERQVWERWKMTISRFIWTAFRSGQFGQLFVGQFLVEVITYFGQPSLTDLAREVPEMRLFRLCREWFRWYLRLSQRKQKDGYTELVDIVAQTLRRLHREIERIYVAERAILEVGQTIL